MSAEEAAGVDRRSSERVRLLRVLVVDDSRAIRRILRRALEGAGYAVDEAPDGEQGLDACRRAPPDLVLLDMDMPVMDGMTALAAMRADDALAAVPVLFLTALTGGTDVAQALDFGAQGYLRKPCEPVELVAQVALALRTSAREQTLARQAREAVDASVVDSLTGLGNRKFLHRLTTQLTLADGGAAVAGVLFMDVDWFKRVNDERGHGVGDMTLRILAGRLSAALGDDAALVRWGGEEFVALAMGRTGRQLAELGERLRSSVDRTPFSVGSDVLLPVTVSVGCASGPLDAFETVVEAADEALYEAKRTGRNRVSVGRSPRLPLGRHFGADQP